MSKPETESQLAADTRLHVKILGRDYINLGRNYIDLGRALQKSAGSIRKIAQAASHCNLLFQVRIIPNEENTNDYPN